MKKQADSTSLAANRTMVAHMLTLLWKNFTLKRRHVGATVFEIALPCLFVLLLGALKHLVDDVAVPAGWSDSSNHDSDTTGTTYNLFDPSGFSLSAIPTELPKWTQYETSVTGLLWYMARLSVVDGVRLNELSTRDYTACTVGVALHGYVDTNSSSESSVPSECGGRVVPYKLAVVPDNAFTREYFTQTMEIWYPRVNLVNDSTSLQVASLRESVAFFDTEDALEEYVKGKSYDSSLENPRIYGGIVFDKYPTDSDIGSFSSIEYTLRLNSTETDSGALGLIPPTNGDAAAL
ncbi:unnamed protein product [Phytophthora fragariaefolia]|uniref:Unnamed protein product n=1 Tax=Phytophthora fragariaefolia TaxID=1490495 RepID=A0A9W6YCL2_9STRA|nr:unnamed protein product [Phytophthora fragariaefolia]